jgi:alpha-L-fucosidase 2
VPVKIKEASAREATGRNSNNLITETHPPPYKKNEKATLVSLHPEKGYAIDFETQKGKKYTIVPK